MDNVIQMPHFAISCCVGHFNNTLGNFTYSVATSTAHHLMNMENVERMKKRWNECDLNGLTYVIKVISWRNA